MFRKTEKQDQPVGLIVLRLFLTDATAKPASKAVNHLSLSSINSS
jgi:hypothetical protein